MTNHQLTRLDTNALNRALLGFDQLFDNFEQRFGNQISNNYPPYNVIKHDENTYEIEVAVTGFQQNEITVEIDQNQLIVKGHKDRKDLEELSYLHRGLATRDFTRSWTLAEHMEVGQGSVKNGVLTIELKRVIPDSLKPRVLNIKFE